MKRIDLRGVFVVFTLALAPLFIYTTYSMLAATLVPTTARISGAYITAITDVASATVPMRSSASSRSARASRLSLSSRSSSAKTTRIVPALHQGAPVSSGSPSSVYVPVSGEHTIDVSGDGVSYNFKSGKSNDQTTDVVFGVARGAVTVNVYEDPTMRRNDARVTYTNGTFDQVDLRICQKVLGLAVVQQADVSWNTLCIQTADGVIVKADLHPAMPLTVRYVAFDDRTLPPTENPAGGNSAGVVQLESNGMAFVDFVKGAYRSNPDDTPYDLVFSTNHNDTISLSTENTKTVLATTIVRYAKVTRKDCLDAIRNYTEGEASLSTSSFTICAKLGNGIILKMSFKSPTSADVTIMTPPATPEQGSGEATVALQSNVDVAYDFSQRALREDPASEGHDVLFTLSNEVVRVRAKNGSGPTGTRFAMPWTTYAETTAQVCTDAMNQSAGLYDMFFIGRDTRVVCFRTPDGFVGKMRAQNITAARANVEFILWQDVGGKYVATPSQNWEDSSTVNVEDRGITSYNFSMLREAANDAETEATVTWDGNQTVYVRSVREGYIRVIAMQNPNFAGCVKALIGSAPREGASEIKGGTGGACVETPNGYVIAIYGARVQSKALVTLSITAWRKAATLAPDIQRTFCSALLCSQTQMCVQGACQDFKGDNALPSLGSTGASERHILVDVHESVSYKIVSDTRTPRSKTVPGTPLDVQFEPNASNPAMIRVIGDLFGGVLMVSPLRSDREAPPYASATYADCVRAIHGGEAIVTNADIKGKEYLCVYASSDRVVAKVMATGKGQVDIVSWIEGGTTSSSSVSSSSSSFKHTMTSSPSTTVLKVGDTSDEFLRYNADTKTTYVRVCKKKRFAGMAYKTVCNNVPQTSTIYTLSSVNGAAIASFGGTETFDAVMEAQCRTAFTSKNRGNSIPFSTNTPVACVQFPDGSVGKVGKAGANGATVTHWPTF